MSTVPIRIDGIGTRKSGTTSAITASNPAELVNVARPKKFVRLFNSEGGAIAKGDLVALDFSASEPASGYGNHIKKADTGDALNMHAVGIAAEAIADGDLGLVQVFGFCDFAICSDLADAGGVALADADEGQFLTVSAEAGRLRDYDSSTALGSGGDSVPVAILIEYGTADTADSQVFLINPLNY